MEGGGDVGSFRGGFDDGRILWFYECVRISEFFRVGWDGVVVNLWVFCGIYGGVFEPVVIFLLNVCSVSLFFCVQVYCVSGVVPV